jgi:glutaredoxin
MEADMDAVEQIRVFWMPGCSSCVKVKEFLTSLNVPYQPVNVLTEVDAYAEMERLGAQGFPLVSRGKDFVCAQSLEDVAKFLGMEVAFEKLPPVVLVDRWIYFLELSRTLAGDIPDHQMQHHPVPNRNRTLHGLAYHVFQVPEAFLECVENGLREFDRYFDSPPPEDVRTQDDVRDYGAAVIARLRNWWAGVSDKSVSWSVDTFYGMQPAHGFLERSTWHSAQHVRQLASALEDLKVEAHASIPQRAYSGLPMPLAIWQ